MLMAVARLLTVTDGHCQWQTDNCLEYWFVQGQPGKWLKDCTQNTLCWFPHGPFIKTGMEVKEPTHMIWTVSCQSLPWVHTWFCWRRVWDLPMYSGPLCWSSHRGTQCGVACTHFVKVLSVIPLPWVIPPLIFNIRMRNCSIVCSEKLPNEKSLAWRMLKKPFAENSVYSSCGMTSSIAFICCKYSLADLAYGRWLAAWKCGIILLNTVKMKLPNASPFSSNEV